ncbi:zinc finger and BTB domain-containing protein 1-like [Carcharodon carcharias]|uniref:zinc finger and BTB domain-containing protein 1-like n=1 Tax=Carcharodon carcharias TaxID=13397 RepID=UPI001B7E5AF2|nr:zinc finger and BTB domain-containing protein 1-like [Carcharodon carcharias]
MQSVSHSEHVLQQLCSQLEYGFLCDCSIVVGDVHFRAHRVLLAACSSYFHKLFVNRPGEAQQVFLSSQAVSPDHFDLILQLMYTGRLESPPSDPERFRASLHFLKLYNAAWFPGAVAPTAAGEREGEGEVPLASGKRSPLVFGVELHQDKNPPAEASTSPANHSGQAPVSIKAESPESAPESQAFLCHHCGLAFEEQRSLSNHLQLHAEKPFHCPLCGLAFEGTQLLQEHITGCLRRQGEEEEEESRKAEERWSLAPEVKREAEPAEGHGSEGPEATYKVAGSGLEKPKVEDPEEEEEQQQQPLVLELSGVTVVRVGGEDAGVSPPGSFGQAEDYELEEGEVRFPGDDDLVLENGSDDGSFSSSDSSLDGDSEGSALTELSDDEGAPGGVGTKAPPTPPSTRGGQPAYRPCSIFGAEKRPASRRRGKAWHCQACEGCRSSEEQPRGPPGRGRLGASRGEGWKNAVSTASASRRCPPECSGRNGPCHISQQRNRQGPGWERVQGAGRAMAKGAKVPARSHSKKGAAGKHFRVPRHKKGTEALEEQQRRFTKTASSRKCGRLKHCCEFCGKGFLQPGHLTEHMATHSKAKQFPCQLCGQKFLRERELRLHVAIHTSDARYECQVCGQGSYHKRSHLRHMACHLSQGQALCQVCFEIFRDAVELERHLESHLHPCGACGEKFKLKKDMVTHATSCWTKKLLDSELDKSSRSSKT